MPAAPIHHAIGNAQQLGQQVKFEVMMMFFKTTPDNDGNLGIKLFGKTEIANRLLDNEYSAALWTVIFVEGFYWEWRGSICFFSIGSMNTNGRFSQEGTQHFSTKWVELIGAIGLETSLLYPQAIMWRWAHWLCFLGDTASARMSQEFSKWLVNGL